VFCSFKADAALLPCYAGLPCHPTAIRQYLCLSLLKNSASSIPAALQLSASIFLSLLQKFRSALKAEVGVFFPMIMLKVRVVAAIVLLQQ